MAELDGYRARLLLYLETRSVDYDGVLDTKHLNEEDHATLKAWNENGYVKSGRVAFAMIGGSASLWCRLSEEAWIEAHRQRRLRAERCFKSRRWQGTAEARGEVKIT